MSELRVTRDGAVVTVALDRAAVRNAFGAALIAELTAVFGALAAGDARAVVLTGAGPVFSAGADADWMRASLGLDHDENVADATAMRAMFEAVDRCPTPVVARVNGHALGGGAGLVACCDVAVATRGALFGFTEVKLGIIPATISPYVLRRIGPGHARALFTTGERFAAERALAIGLVHRVVPADALDEAVAEVVGELLSSGPHAVAEAKRLVRDAGAGLALDDLPQRLAAVRVSPEGQEGLRAFLERRPAAWRP